ncbi:MAG: prolipoprotein diacylglyceryl transferase [Planctomycetaceae bacterium]|nr:prolipoprotein diacylglyceryl transferase [Planctomycetaceae bacterium]
MRKVLLRIIFDQLWLLQSQGNELLVGYGWAIVAWCVCAAVGLGVLWKLTRDMQQVKSSLLFWGAIPAVLAILPRLNLPVAQSGIPVFGYGFMMFVGFSTGTVLAARRAKSVGLEPDVVWDLMMWLLIPGLIGARIIYLSQNWQRVMGGKTGVEFFKSAIALWDGGIVFYGCIIGGVVGLLIYCRRIGVPALQLADVIMPSLFVGLGFGRIGCFLYGCCYGGVCDLPWAVQFPPDSMTFEALTVKNSDMLMADGSATVPLHPTQIYSSALAFLLAGILTWYFRRRPFEGAVFALGWMLYPVNRFILESIRDDEPDRLLGMTFSQSMSVALFVMGCVLMFWLQSQNRRQSPESTAQPTADTPT